MRSGGAAVENRAGVVPGRGPRSEAAGPLGQISHGKRAPPGPIKLLSRAGGDGRRALQLDLAGPRTSEARRGEVANRTEMADGRALPLFLLAAIAACIPSVHPKGRDGGAKGCQQEVPPYRFYIYDLGMAERCRVDTPEGIKAQLTQWRPDEKQHFGEVFFYFQMLKHPWRTEDPSKAFLFFVPIMTSLSVRGKCGSHKDNLEHVAVQLLASPWYQRSKGGDHLIMYTDFRFSISVRHGFAAALFKNFMVGRKKLPTQHPGQCTFLIPHTSPMALTPGNCRIDVSSGIPTCSSYNTALESTFEDFLANRNYTMFFMGQADDRMAYRSRRIGLQHLPAVDGPNWIAGTGQKPSTGRRDCTPGRWDGCHIQTKADEGPYSQGMVSSKLSLFFRGDDPSSCRMFDAIDAGTPVLLLSDKYLENVAHFRCRVPWKQIVFKLSEVEFAKDPAEVMRQALHRLQRGGPAHDPQAVLRGLWEAQRLYREDLLWHVEGSRVGNNALEEVWRRCTSGKRAGLWDAYNKRSAGDDHGSFLGPIKGLHVSPTRLL